MMREHSAVYCFGSRLDQDRKVIFQLPLPSCQPINTQCIAEAGPKAFSLIIGGLIRPPSSISVRIVRYRL